MHDDNEEKKTRLRASIKNEEEEIMLLSNTTPIRNQELLKVNKYK